jgi:hypothetical protein
MPKPYKPSLPALALEQWRATAHYKFMHKNRNYLGTFKALAEPPISKSKPRLLKPYKLPKPKQSRS